MKIKFWLGLTVLLVVAILLGSSNDTMGLGNKKPSPEIIAATQKALSPRLFSSEADEEEGPDEEETRFVVMYAFSPVAEKCSLCTKDIQDMFEALLFNS